MKKILFVIAEFAHGGANKTLENYLPLIDRRRFEFFVYCHSSSRREGYYFELFKPYLVRLSWLGRLLKETKVVRGVFGRLCSMIPALGQWYSRYEAKSLQRRYQFDNVVGFQELETTECASHFPSTQHVAWLHAFVDELASPTESPQLATVYKLFDRVVCVSDNLKEYFSNCFPSLASKAFRIYNPLDIEYIKQQSKEPLNDSAFDNSSFTLLSIGRLDSIKNFHQIPRIAHEMIRAGAKPFRWYIIGSAFHDSYRQEVVREITKYGVQDSVLLLGTKDNPYPYIAHSDLVVCTSRSESFSYVLNEAMVLHIPVVSNNFPVASEVVPINCGRVASLKDMPSVLCDLVNNTNEDYDRLKQGVAKFSYDNGEIILQFNTTL